MVNSEDKNWNPTVKKTKTKKKQKTKKKRGKKNGVKVRGDSCELTQSSK